MQLKTGRCRAEAEAIYKVANDRQYTQELIREGEAQLKTYDSYEQRAVKIIEILEDISTKK